MKDFLYSLVIPFIFTVLGIVMSAFMQTTLVEGVIITLCLGTFSAILSQSYVNVDAFNDQKDEHVNISRRISNVELSTKFNSLINNIEHPYFQKWGRTKIQNFISENNIFFQGFHITNPYADDTFGIEGISYTQKKGSLKCVSSIPDYWDDPFMEDYLTMQINLVKNRGVNIQRIFLFESANHAKYQNVMEKQHLAGIEVFYIHIDNSYFNKSYIEDFLIQDDVLLVCLEGSNHKYSNELAETITIDESVVSKKLERFARLIERATRYPSNRNS